MVLTPDKSMSLGVGSSWLTLTHGKTSESLVDLALPSEGQNSDVSLLSHFTCLCFPSALTTRSIDKLNILAWTQPVPWVKSEQAETQFIMGVS